MQLRKTLQLVGLAALFVLAACDDEAEEPRSEESVGEEVEESAEEAADDVDEAADETAEEVDKEL